MKYDKTKIVESHLAGEKLKYVFFWGHQPNRDGKLTSSCFSQWWESQFNVEDISYPSAEHWMMAEKAKLFKDQENLEKNIE